MTLDLAPVIKDWLQNEDFLEIVLKTILEYQKLAIKIIKSDKEKQKENVITYQNLTHKQCIDKFISILNFLLQWIPFCKMDITNLDLMYKIFVEQKASEYDAD